MGLRQGGGGSAVSYRRTWRAVETSRGFGRRRAFFCLGSARRVGWTNSGAGGVLCYVIGFGDAAVNGAVPRRSRASVSFPGGGAGRSARGGVANIRKGANRNIRGAREASANQSRIDASMRNLPTESPARILAQFRGAASLTPKVTRPAFAAPMDA